MRKTTPSAYKKLMRATVAVKVDLPRELDRAMEIRAAELDVSKRQFVEDAVRGALALPHKA